MQPAAIFDQLMLALPLPILAVNAAGQVVQVNDAAQEFFMASATRLQQHNLTQLLGEGHGLLDLLGVAVNEHAPVREKHMAFNFGKVIYADVLVYPIDDAAQMIGILIQPLGVADTIDQHFTAQKSASHVSSIAGVLAHEIKNPLAGIRGAAQLLALSASEDEQPLTQLITDETDRITRLIDHMEQFGAGAPPAMAQFNIHEVLGHVQQLAQAGFAQNIDFIEEYDPSLPDVWGSRDQMIQLILNLVKNAAEACEGVEEPQIKLTTAFRPGLWVTQDGGTRVHLPLEVCVHDNGCGIPEAVKPHIFEPFNTSKPTGRGLGLALAAKIIRDHGGLISADSTPSGTRFKLVLPWVR